jgi:hypothetical protein
MNDNDKKGLVCSGVWFSGMKKGGNSRESVALGGVFLMSNCPPWQQGWLHLVHHSSNRSFSVPQFFPKHIQRLQVYWSNPHQRQGEICLGRVCQFVVAIWRITN